MSELISGKDAKLAWASNKEVEYMPLDKWNLLGGSTPLSIFDRDDVKFRLKPRTITVNGIEVPAPFEPKEGETYWCFSTQTALGYGHNFYESERVDRRFINMGAWRTEEEIKQVVAALRQVFGIKK
jgi:hypothetical protein